MTAISSDSPPSSTTNFWNRLGQWLIQPSAKIQTPDGRRQAQLMSGLTLATIVLVSIRIVIGFRSGSYLEDEGFFLYYLIWVSMSIAYIFSRTKYVLISTLIFVVSITALPYQIVFIRQSVTPLQNINSLLWILPGFILGAFLFPFWISALWMGSNFALLLFLPRFYPGIDSDTLSGLVFTIFVLTVLNILLNRYRSDIENDRQKVVLATNRELQILNTSLEARISERTRVIQTTAEVSRRLSTILDTNELVLQVVEQVNTAFNYYHTHIYLLDEEGKTLKMVGGTGEVGQTLLERGHTVSIERGLVGQAARTHRTVLVPDTGADANWLPNPLLPDTKSEIAVPIIYGDIVLGVLDVQQNVVNGLTVEDQNLLESIASQAAIALQNASVLESFQQNAEALRQSQELFQTILETAPAPILISNANDGTVLYANEQLGNIFGLLVSELIGRPTPDFYYEPADRETLIGKVRQEGYVNDYELHVKKADGTPFWVSASLQPIKYQDSIALLAIFYDLTYRKMAEEKLAKRADRDRTLNRISTKIRSAVSMEQVLQTAVQELRQATKASRGVAIIDPNEETMSLQPISDRNF